MSRRFSKSLVFALAVLFATAPLVLAQTYGSGSGTTGSQSGGQIHRPESDTAGQKGAGTTGMGASPTGQQSGQQHMGAPATDTKSSQMGTKGANDAIHATVTEVNLQHKTVKLRMQGGETVELKVPEQSLSTLNKGDSVQVSIRKAEAHPGTRTIPQSRPESNTSGTSGTSTKSRQSQ